MADERSDTSLQTVIDRLLAGDPTAPDALINHSYERLRRMARKMLKAYPHVRRWNETDDVLHSALTRMQRALKATVPQTVAGYFGLAATQIRRELIDLARHHYGPEGDGRHHASDPKALNVEGKVVPRVDAEADPRTGPEGQVQWQEFHEQVERLPEEERQVFDLIFYQGLTQPEAARVLDKKERMVRRLWREARIKLGEMTKNQMPEE